ncbi:MAG TPA: ferritin family protein [Gemmatimonadaceae bacterium]|nr:ferritin family protein [Gemmatimonadaceae bacterium]
MRKFNSLTEKEVLALAISLEEEDERIYADYAAGLKARCPASAAVCSDMQGEESMHRLRLLDLYRQRFGYHVPLIRRQDVRGFVHRRPTWLLSPLDPETVRTHASVMEIESRRFYERAAARTHDPSIRQLLDDLAQEERGHEARADTLTARRLFALQVLRPGLAGVMSSSVSTLAAVFAAAFVTHRTWDAFVVGLAASIGAGISTGLAKRGLVSGLITALGGIAIVIVALWTITWIHPSVLIVNS